MCRSNPPKQKAPAVTLSSLYEHFAKGGVYSLLAAHSANSALASTTLFSYAFNILIGIFALWLIKGEIDFLIKRINRRLPPGYLGIPIWREINLFRSLNDGGIIRALDAARKEHNGKPFLNTFAMQTNVVCGSQPDLEWLFKHDRMGDVEVNWPPNIQMLLGSRAVALQTGKYHRALRRLMNPYFLPKFVENYLECMDTTTMDELERWAGTGGFVSSEVFKMYALRLFYASSFGRVDEDIITSLHDDFTVWLGGFLPGPAFFSAMKARERILATVDTLITDFEKENPEDSKRAQTTIMGRLIYARDKDSGQTMTREEIKDNLLNLIFAGHDTTYASISTLLHHMSQNPEAMDALTEETLKLSEPLTSEKLKEAPILNACMHESWRMDPPVFGAFRKAVKELPHRGYSFESGTVFNYSILLAASDEKVYQNQSTFDMRRFLPKDHPLYDAGVDSGIDPLQGRANYPIFGGGTHVCMGKAFAQLELRVLLARMTKHYEVEVRNSKKVHLPVNGWSIEFKLTKRKDA